MPPHEVPDGTVPPVRGQVWWRWWRTPVISRPSQCWRELNGASCQLLVSDDELEEDEGGGGPARAGGLEVEVLLSTEGWFWGSDLWLTAARQHSKCDSPMQRSDVGAVLLFHFSLNWNKQCTSKYQYGHGTMTWSHMWMHQGDHCESSVHTVTLHLNSVTGYSGAVVIRKHLAHWEISNFTVLLKPEICRFAWERTAVTLQLQSS